jgi:hypothetical protein
VARPGLCSLTELEATLGQRDVFQSMQRLTGDTDKQFAGELEAAVEDLHYEIVFGTIANIFDNGNQAFAHFRL